MTTTFQALSVAADSLNSGHSVGQHAAQSPPRAARNHLLAERKSLTHKFSIAGHEGYITVGLYPDGQPGELFIIMAKAGSTIAGLMNSFALDVSIALQHGVPLKLLCEKFSHTRFEPSGWTENHEIGYAKSITDYIFRWLELRFLGSTPQSNTEDLAPHHLHPSTALPELADRSDAPACQSCGAITVRSGSCYRCLNCGSTTGCG